MEKHCLCFSLSLLHSAANPFLPLLGKCEDQAGLWVLQEKELVLGWVGLSQWAIGIYFERTKGAPGGDKRRGRKNVATSQRSQSGVRKEGESLGAQWLIHHGASAEEVDAASKGPPLKHCLSFRKAHGSWIRSHTWIVLPLCKWMPPMVCTQGLTSYLSHGRLVKTLAHQCQHLNRWPLNGSDSCLGNNTSAQSPNT